MFVDIIYGTDGCPSHFLSEDETYLWKVEDVAFSYYKYDNAETAIAQVMTNHPGGHLVTLDGITPFTIWATTAAAVKWNPTEE